jgi:hypothetical protein
MLTGYVKFLLRLDFDFIWVWVVLMACGWAFSYFEYYRKKSCKVESFAGKIIGRLWLSFGITMTIVGFGGYFSKAINGEFISALMAIILGAAYYISSALYEWKGFRYIALFWWIGGFAMFYVRDISQLLIMAGLMIFGQVVPGIILYRKYKAQFSEEVK